MTCARSVGIQRIGAIPLTILLLACGSHPDQTADRFMSLLVDGKHLQAQDMLSKDMRSTANMLGGVSNETLNPYYRSGTFKSYTLSEIERTDKSVRYKVVAVTAAGQTYDDIVDLVREDGTWKVARF